MIGIYKITNISSGKVYIGQSNNIQRRFKEHKQRANPDTPVDFAIKKYGSDAFSYDIIEECDAEKLNERESYWIKYYNSVENGYNCNFGGEQQSIGENNGRAKLTENDVILIRQAYAQHKPQKKNI